MLLFVFARARTLVAAGLAGLALAGVTGAAGDAVAQGRATGQVFRDCSDICPEMVVAPSGAFMMGTPSGSGGGAIDERPQRRVTFARPFAVGRFEVTFAEWEACVKEGGCPRATHPVSDGPGHDEGWGRGRQPVVNVRWSDADAYARWLSARTGQRYRLLSEAEWEYVARAGSSTLYATGDVITGGDANYMPHSPFVSDTDHSRAIPVGSYAPNAFGVYDMHGNVLEWVQDCYAPYDDAPVDGRAVTDGDCSQRVLRGGGWRGDASSLRSAARFRFQFLADLPNDSVGFRIARDL
jgi:formylglycine-generating enzyme required for sulfatase activity